MPEGSDDKDSAASSALDPPLEAGDGVDAVIAEGRNEAGGGVNFEAIASRGGLRAFDGESCPVHKNSTLD